MRILAINVTIKSLYNFRHACTNIGMWNDHLLQVLKLLLKNFEEILDTYLGGFFWAPILQKRYQNMSGFASEVHLVLLDSNYSLHNSLYELLVLVLRDCDTPSRIFFITFAGTDNNKARYLTQIFSLAWIRKAT